MFRLGCIFFYDIVFQAHQYSVRIANDLIDFSFSEMKATLFEIPIETLRIPAHLFLEQGRRHKQILYAPVATPPSFQIYEAMIVPYYEEIISFCEVLY